MKKSMLVVLVLLVCSTMVSASMMSINLVPSKSIVNVGETFTVTVQLKTDVTVANAGGIATAAVSLFTPAANAGISVVEDAIAGKAQMSYAAGFVGSGNPMQGNRIDTTTVGTGNAPAVTDGDWDVTGMSFANSGTTKTLGRANTWVDYCTVSFVATKEGIFNLTGQIKGAANSAYQQYYNSTGTTKTNFSVVGQNFSTEIQVVPEPVSIVLLAIGGLLLRRKSC
jgi:hypothetical protein